MINVVSLGKRFAYEQTLRKDIEKVFLALGISRTVLCEIYIVSSASMLRLNKRFRHKNHATTVLSFPVETYFPIGAHALLGEIYVSPRDIARRPPPGFVHKRHVGFYEKLVYHVIHGILHMRGYDHEGGWAQAKRMEGIEQLVWYRLFPCL